MMLLQVLEPEIADMATERFGAVEPEDEFGRRIEIADVKIAIDDHHGVVRPLKRGQQEIRGFGHGVIACAHHPTLMPVLPVEVRSRRRGVICVKRMDHGC